MSPTEPAPFRAAWLFWPLYALCLAALTAGLLLPALRVTEWRIFDTTYSLLGGMDALRRSGDWPVLIIVFTFSVVLPYLKLALLAWVWRRGLPSGSRRALEIVDGLGRWSMIDVMVVAVAVVTLQGNFFVRTSLEHGIYVFAAAALLSMALISWSRRLAHRLERSAAREKADEPHRNP